MQGHSKVANVHTYLLLVFGLYMHFPGFVNGALRNPIGFCEVSAMGYSPLCRLDLVPL
jgi:hypothetical protein